jgi:hypothetical protein
MNGEIRKACDILIESPQDERQTTSDRRTGKDILTWM